MGKYIQIGVTSLRDPVTGEALPSVPMYIRADDAPAQARAVIEEGPLAKEFAELMKRYVNGTKGGCP